MKNLTFANRWNADLIDQNYETWLTHPEALSADWRSFFEGFELAQLITPKSKKQPSSLPKDIQIGETSILGAINTYRRLGHTQARINPLNPNTQPNPSLGIAQLGIKEEDLDKTFFTGDYLGGKHLKAQEILERLKSTYCNTIGFEYMHIQNTAKRRWIQDHIEPAFDRTDFSHEKCIRILRRINHAEMFEHFLHTRYVGQKRFSLEGAETIIAALDAVLEKSPALGIKEVIMGMAHRGRLNVLANILGKSYKFVFKEFTENYIPESIYGDGDVKYHLGYENTHLTQSGEKINICLAANPSHLEAVNPIVEGQARARQRLHSKGKIDRSKVLPILIHGDAAIAGQGIVAEVFNLSKLDGYTTGGTLHFVINNQIGFTTSPEQSRSSFYCTDIAKMIEAPIMHVNGDDPIAMVMAAELALMYRQEFGEDVIIDMYCYRRHGHNESDEPGFTQPLLYKQIANHPLISTQFSNKLIEEGILEASKAAQIKTEFEEKLDEAFKSVKEETERTKQTGKHSSRPYLAQQNYSFEIFKTGVPKKELESICKALTNIPSTFKVNHKISRQLKTKANVFEKGEGIDWGFAEALAYGSLLAEGIPIRLSGQDSERGTFSHRHAVLYDLETKQKYVPLNHIHPQQATFCVHNSSLSEASVLGFDFGYSLDYPQMLCIWEAQFGDFANGAQVIIDQFITCCETKWQSVSGITLLLPHGYEGQGPEHSSARLERFLQACAEDNIQVANVTTPAQFFHLIRKQKKHPFIKPLVVMSPKSLLRHKLCVSSLEELTSGHFQPILGDSTTSHKKVKRIIFCSGKVYYDLFAFREANKIKDVALVRIEQLYPLDKKTILTLLKQHKQAKEIVWCQEEPKNMGAWHFIAPELQTLIGDKNTLLYAGRRSAASPATGVLAIHKVEQESLIEEAFNIK